MTYFNQPDQQVRTQYNAAGDVHHTQNIKKTTILRQRPWIFGISTAVIIVIAGAILLVVTSPHTTPRANLLPADVVNNYCQALANNDFTQAASYLDVNNIPGNTPITPDTVQRRLQTLSTDTNLGPFQGCTVNHVSVSDTLTGKHTADVEIVTTWENLPGGLLGTCDLITIDQSWFIWNGMGQSCPGTGG